MWRPSGVQPVQPPIKRRPPGRPKKKRTREAGEAAGRRASISKQCRTCGKIGHNKRSCKGEIGGNSSSPSTTNRTSVANKVTFYHICQVNESFYILHVNKCGFPICRPADAKTIPTSISQQDKLKLNQVQPPHLHHLSHLYHPSPPCTPSLLVHQLSHGETLLVHCHHSSPAFTPSVLVHFLSHGQAFLGHVQHTKPACTSHLAQVHHTGPTCTSHLA